MDILISIIALGISIAAWRKSRNLYGVEVIETGRKSWEKDLNDKMKSGKYTIIHVGQDSSNSMRHFVILGKLKR